MAATMLVINDRLYVPDEEIHFSYARSSGKGGQNVNKVNSKAVLTWCFVENRSLPEDVRARFHDRYMARLTNAGEIVLQSDRFRDQPRNISDCLEKLRQMILDVAVAPKRRKKTKPTFGSKQRRLDGKKRDSVKKKLRSERY